MAFTNKTYGKQRNRTSKHCNFLATSKEFEYILLNPQTARYKKICSFQNRCKWGLDCHYHHILIQEKGQKVTEMSGNQMDSNQTNKEWNQNNLYIGQSDIGRLREEIKNMKERIKETENESEATRPGMLMLNSAIKDIRRRLGTIKEFYNDGEKMAELTESSKKLKKEIIEVKSRLTEIENGRVWDLNKHVIEKTEQAILRNLGVIMDETEEEDGDDSDDHGQVEDKGQAAGHEQKSNNQAPKKRKPKSKKANKKNMRNNSESRRRYNGKKKMKNKRHSNAQKDQQRRQQHTSPEKQGIRISDENENGVVQNEQEKADQRDLQQQQHQEELQKMSEEKKDSDIARSEQQQKEQHASQEKQGMQTRDENGDDALQKEQEKRDQDDVKQHSSSETQAVRIRDENADDIDHSEQINNEMISSVEDGMQSRQEQNEQIMSIEREKWRIKQRQYGLEDGLFAWMSYGERQCQEMILEKDEEYVKAKRAMDVAIKVLHRADSAGKHIMRKRAWNVQKCEEKIRDR